jgi:AAA+ superfamily predicted ATPase
MNKLLEFNLQTLRPLTYIVAEEEDILIKDIYEKTKQNSQIFIYRSTTGLIPYAEYEDETNGKNIDIKTKTMPINSALSEIQSNKSDDKRLIYLLCDVDNFFQETQSTNFQNIRKLKDIVLNIYYDYVYLKTIIIISPSLVIPTKLQRYSEVIYYDLPNDEVIEEKIKYLLTKYNLVSKSKIPLEIHEDIKSGLKGLTLFEIEQIVMASLKKKKQLCLEEVNTYKRTILRKTDLLDAIETNVTFDEIGGLNRLKKWFEKRKDIWSEEAIKLKIPTIKGIMILGVTGCGKSLLAKALGNYWGLPLISFQPGKIFSSRVGESEARLYKTLKILESVAPAVILIDEIEKQFAGSQSSTFSDAGTTARFIGTFLTWYEDCTAPLFIVSTCNDIQYLPPELISRFDDKFFVPIPSATDRASIYDIQLKKAGRDAQQLGLNLHELALKSSFFTGREIEQVVKAGLIEMWYECKTTGNNNNNIVLEQKHLLRVLESKVPIQKTKQEELNFLVQWVGWDNEKKEGIRANYASEREDDIDTLFNEILSRPSVLDKDKRRP